MNIFLFRLLCRGFVVYATIKKNGVADIIIQGE